MIGLLNLPVTEIQQSDHPHLHHGTSGPVFVLGERIKGGFYGDQPALNNLKNDDLAVTTDFRDIYASITEKVLGTSAERILGNWKGRTPIFK